MLLMNNPYATAFWQPFPIWISIAQHGYLAIRPRTVRSGYKTTQAAYTAAFLTGAISHMYYAAPTLLVGDFAGYHAAHLPDLAIDASSSTVQTASLGLIQWDILFVGLSTLCGCLWTAKHLAEFAGIIAWLVVGSIFVGPGAAVVAIFALRERKLNTPVVNVPEKIKR